jgi:hypothetical protein
MLGVCAILVCAGLSGVRPAFAASAAEASKSTPSEERKSKQQTRSSRVVVKPGSAETPAERAARLKRECKGLPNAGACTGYAQ